MKPKVFSEQHIVVAGLTSQPRRPRHAAQR